MSQRDHDRLLERFQKAKAYQSPRLVLKLQQLITNKDFITRLANLKLVTDATLYQKDGDRSDAVDLLMRGIEKVNEGLDPEAPPAQFKKSVLAICQDLSLHPSSCEDRYLVSYCSAYQDMLRSPGHGWIVELGASCGWPMGWERRRRC
jgi:hypothetical protein